ncbi:MAG: phosphatase PAP2 family protein [Paludibacteraceae bacterium]|nr:phosphatase PAP2 family protein [Paludibacteraceae bacterium]
MLKLLRSNIVFIILSLMLLLALGLALMYIPKGDLHWLLCNRHTPARDIFFRYYTHVAEWFPYVLCVLLLLFGRVGNGLFASAAMVFSSLTTQICKHLINAPRPVTWFAENMPDIRLPLVEGVDMNYWHSFPSGHTTSFFALAFVASILITKRLTAHGLTGVAGMLQALLFLLAALGGYSRIYLCQHFALDVFAGVMVGLLITCICYAIFSRFEDKKWYNYRLLTKK